MGARCCRPTIEVTEEAELLRVFRVMPDGPGLLSIAITSSARTPKIASMHGAAPLSLLPAPLNVATALSLTNAPSPVAAPIGGTPSATLDTTARTTLPAKPPSSGSQAQQARGVRELPRAALAALTGLYTGDYAMRMRSWDGAVETVWNKFQETPRDHPFLVYIDGPMGAGKSTLARKLKDVFEKRLQLSGGVW